MHRELGEPPNRYHPKGVFRKGVGNSQNASKMRQKRVKMGLVVLGKEERPKCVICRGSSLLSDQILLNSGNAK